MESDVQQGRGKLGLHPLPLRILVCLFVLDVDDITSVSSSADESNRFREQLRSQWEISDLSPIKHALDLPSHTRHWDRRRGRASGAWGQADVAGHDRLADLNFDVVDLARHEKLLALFGNSETVFAGEGARLDADPDEDGGDGLSDETDASDVRARPLIGARAIHEDWLGVQPVIVVGSSNTCLISGL